MENVVENVDGIARDMADEAAQILARLAEIEELRERWVAEVEARLARLEKAGSPSGEWMSTGEVARELGVTPAYVYEHQTELGVHRKGGGRRPRLTFNRAAVEAHRKKPGGPNENAIRLREARRGKACTRDAPHARLDQGQEARELDTQLRDARPRVGALGET